MEKSTSDCIWVHFIWGFFVLFKIGVISGVPFLVPSWPLLSHTSGLFSFSFPCGWLDKTGQVLASSNGEAESEGSRQESECGL